MSDGMALYLRKGTKELLCTHPAVANMDWLEMLLPAYESDEQLWAAIQKLRGWEEHAPGYQGCFGIGGGAYISAQKDETGVSFALSFGEGFLHDESDIRDARRTLNNFEQLLAFQHDYKPAHQTEPSND